MIVSSTARPCAATTKAGKRCQAPANDSGYCTFHDPTMAAKRAIARRRGGLARHGRTVGAVGGDDQSVTLTTISDALALIERTATDLLKLENSVARARALLSAATSAVSVIEATELEQRLKAVEERLETALEAQKSRGAHGHTSTARAARAAARAGRNTA